MLKNKLHQLIAENGKVETYKILLNKLKLYRSQMIKANSINECLDIEHNILDTQTMIKWLKQEER